MLKTIWVAGLLALALTACGQSTPEGTEPESENTAVENSVADNASSGETAANGDADDASTNENEGDAGEPVTDETGAAAGAESEAEAATAGPSPSPDPTLQAFYEGFTIPLKGDADAKVVIYEFSDYL